MKKLEYKDFLEYTEYSSVSLDTTKVKKRNKILFIWSQPFIYQYLICLFSKLEIKFKYYPALPNGKKRFYYNILGTIFSFLKKLFIQFKNNKYYK